MSIGKAYRGRTAECERFHDMLGNSRSVCRACFVSRRFFYTTSASYKFFFYIYIIYKERTTESKTRTRSRSSVRFDPSHLVRDRVESESCMLIYITCSLRESKFICMAVKSELDCT